MNDKPSHQSPENKRRFSLVIWICSAVVGFIAGLAGSLLLTHALIHQPLQVQQDRINEQHILHQQQTAQFQQQIAQQAEAIGLLREEIQSLLMADSSGRIKELAAIQKENKEQETYLLQLYARLEQQISHMENSNHEFREAIDKAKSELDRADKSLRDDMRLLQSALHDLNTKIQQLERQFTTR